MVSRAVPLVVDILVTALARVRLHEELAGNLFSAIDLRGAGKKWAGRAVAFAVHADGWKGGIFNPSMLVPAAFAEIASDGRQHRQHGEYGGNAKNGMTGHPSAIAQPGRGDQADTEKTHADMDVDERPFRAQGSCVNQRQAWDCAEEQVDHSDANQRLTLTPPAYQPEQQQD